jgi:hypothetical protein
MNTKSKPAAKATKRISKDFDIDALMPKGKKNWFKFRSELKKLGFEPDEIKNLWGHYVNKGVLDEGILVGKPTKSTSLVKPKPKPKAAAIKPKSKRGRAQRVGGAGQFFVAAELNRRGAHTAIFLGNMPKIDLVATNVEQTRTVSIQVKTRRAGTWHANNRDAEPREENSKDDRFWIFVDLSNKDQHPDYYIVPEWWLKNNMYEVCVAYEEKKGRKVKFPFKSEHHSIPLSRIEQWGDRWDVLGLDLEEVE